MTMSLTRRTRSSPREGCEDRVSRSVSIDDLATEITAAVREYTEDVTEAIEQEVDETSKQLVKDIRNDSPRKTGEYSKGWTRKKVSSGGHIAYVIYNRKKGSIAHLLEFGHAKRGGGRVPGRPHIRPNYDRTEPEMMRRIKAVIRNGGRV